MPLRVIRYGEPTEMEVQLGAFESTAPDRTPPSDPRSGADLLGFRVAPLGEADIRHLPVDGPRVQVREVDRFGPAAAKLGSGAVLLTLGGAEVHTVDDVQRFASGLRSGDVVSAVLLVPQPDTTLRRRIVNYRAR